LGQGSSNGPEWIRGVEAKEPALGQGSSNEPMSQGARSGRDQEASKPAMNEGARLARGQGASIGPGPYPVRGQGAREPEVQGSTKERGSQQ